MVPQPVNMDLGQICYVVLEPFCLNRQDVRKIRNGCKS